jgi:hypothetical protein
MFTDYNDNAFKTTLNGLNESKTITIDYINKEVKLKKDSSEENNLKIVVNSRILKIFWIVPYSICNQFCPLLQIHPSHSVYKKFIPTHIIEIEVDIVKKTAKIF